MGGHLAPECLWILDRLYVFSGGGGGGGGEIKKKTMLDCKEQCVVWIASCQV